MKIEQVSIGGWFQRTTLHLSEIYDLCKDGSSSLPLESSKLKKFQKSLDIKTIEWVSGDLDKVVFLSEGSIETNIFEDGLIIINIKAKGDIADLIKEVTYYYEKKLSPALGYIFSLGAPVPKELANIQIIYPYFILLQNATSKTIASMLSSFKEERHIEVKRSKFEIYRGKQIYIINNQGESNSVLQRFIEEQVFIREFKNQLHHYLNLHRIIWEKIADVKEKGVIKGNQIGELKDKIEGYSKTINLIEARINQMGTYIITREDIVKKDKELEKLVDVLQFKYETLSDTLDYVKHVWTMTKNYVASALTLFSDIQAKSTETSVGNLTIVTSMGVGATIIGLFTSQPPEFSWKSVVYVLILGVIGYIADKLVKHFSINRMYTINDIEADKNIK
ncbi:MAG TPA: hypothetical protein VGE63_03540 [Candidatus Paceibacterota bacterium]